MKNTKTAPAGQTSAIQAPQWLSIIDKMQFNAAVQSTGNLTNRFESLRQEMEQLQRDVAACRRVLEKYAPQQNRPAT